MFQKNKAEAMQSGLAVLLLLTISELLVGKVSLLGKIFTFKN